MRRRAVIGQGRIGVARQRGVVLILALLVVTVVVGLAVSFAASFQLDVARGENRWHGGQARGFLVGAESLALAVLARDKRNGDVDHLGEDWAQQLAPFEVDGGWLQAYLEDAQGRFNLNSLAGTLDQRHMGHDDARRFTTAQRRFIRLLQTFDEVPLSVDEAVALTEAVIDWLDTDDDITGFGGAESDHYQQLETGYSAANRDFVSIEELRLVRDVSDELFEQLAPLLVVLPRDAGLNVNTMSLPLLRTLQHDTELSPLALYDAQMIIDSRNAKGFSTVDRFLASQAVRDALASGSAAAPEKEGLVVASQFFLLHARAEVMQQQRRMTSLIRRYGADIAAIRRTDR